MAGTDEFVVLPVPHTLQRVVRGATGYRVTGFQPGIYLGMPTASVTLIIDFSDGLFVGEPGAFHVSTHGIVRRSALSARLHPRAPEVHPDGRHHGIERDLDPLAARELFGLPVGELVQGVSHARRCVAARALQS